MTLFDPMDQSYGLTRRPKRFRGSQHFDYPPSHPSTGSQTNVPRPRGYGAPLQNTRPDVTLDQRMSERKLAFLPRHPYQGWLRQRKTIQVTPTETNAHKLTAPNPYDMNYGATDPRIGPIRSVTHSYGGAGSMTTPNAYGQTASQAGMYARDYSLQTQQGQQHIGALTAAPLFQSTPGYTDLVTQQVLNGQYSQINQDMAKMYLNLRAPTPFESLGPAGPASV